MKIAFIQFVQYEYLGIMYLSASLKERGHDTAVFIDSRDEDRFLADLFAYGPDVVGFSVMTGSEDRAVSLARKIKSRRNIYAVFGGPHPTFLPDMIEQDGVDCICFGEAERTLVEIVELLAQGETPERIAGTWCKSRGRIVRNKPMPLEQDLTRIPWPDRTLYGGRRARSGSASVIAGRGCPYDCTFCSNRRLAELYRGTGPYVRRRPVRDVFDEIKAIKRARRLRSVYFEDDTFSLNKTWLLEFLHAYPDEIGLPFSCQVRADTVDEEIVRNLAAAGCTSVSFGVETGNEEHRHRVLKKRLTDAQITACARLLKKYRIRFRTYNILGLPGETLDDAFRTVHLNTAIAADLPWCSLYQPLPGTELAASAAADGLLDPGAQGPQPSFYRSSRLRLERKHEIENLQKLFFYAVKFPSLEGVIRRAIRCRPNRFYDGLFLLGHAWVYFFGANVTIRELIEAGRANVKRYLGSTCP